ncbi:phosphodiesterase [Rhodoligotrophos defluvii]|uniref:phosphodiesterase n=1 Tax=Rhodoligotrophos defluvii TaxID=2561934 RepID=UPI0010C9C576|nr:phosphodiesterase [Rhodoligotrophos defluvii]
MKIVHLSDTHIVAAPAMLYGLDPRERFRLAVGHINAHHADAALCVVTGDLAHWGEPDAYETFRGIAGELIPPVALLIGNHDDRATFTACFPDAPRDQNGFVQSSRPVGGHTLLTLDTKGEEGHAGAYCSARLAWLETELAGAAGPVLIFMHHPPFAVGIARMDEIALADRKAFAEIVKPHAHRISHLFLGHLHRPVAGNWLGIPFTVVRSINHQVALRFGAEEKEVFGCQEPPAYGVAILGEDGLVVHGCDFLNASSDFSLDVDELKGRSHATEMPAPA